MGFPAVHYGSFGDERTSSSTKINGMPLGIKMVYPDGREFVHARAGASALVAGKVYTAPSGTADVLYGTGLNLAATVAVGATSVAATAGGTTAVTKDQYADGFLVTASSAGTGIGYSYKIKANNSAATGATVTFTLYETDSVQVAMAGGTTKVTVTPNQYNLVELAPASTALFGRITGVACATAAASSYVWLQTKGEASVFCGATTAIRGETLVCSTAAAGAVVPIVASTAGPTSDKAMINVVGVAVSIAETAGFVTANLKLS